MPSVIEVPIEMPISPKNDTSSDENPAANNEEIIIGSTKLDPLSTSHCWSCFVSFKEGSENYYTQHEHPTLSVVVCSVCHDGGEFAERKALEALDKAAATSATSTSTAGLNVGSITEEESETYCSFCSLPSSQLDPPHPPLADERHNDLFLCDSCPRAFCQKCICVSLGGSKSDLDTVRKAASEDGEWKCCLCHPTDFLNKMKQGYASLLEEDGTDNTTSQEEENERIARLIDELHGAEQKYSEAQFHLEDEQINAKRLEIASEILTDSNIDSAEKVAHAEEEIESYKSLWSSNAERIQETIGKLLNELEDGGVNVSDVYRFWDEEKEGGEMDVDVVPAWKREADLALGARDVNEGFTKGEFRGATGYKAKDTRIYKLEPEDLNTSSLKEIEDINTTEGAIYQMNRLKSHQEKSNQWGSKTGTTEEDIEMFEKKCTRFEEVTLGDKIDLKALEKNYIKDADDEIRVKTEGPTMTVRRKNGNGRVVKRTASVRSTKMQDDKETVSAQLSGYSKEYKPSVPAPRQNSAEAAPKAKKRAQLLSSFSSLSASSIEGMIGSNVPFVDSDIVLPLDKSTVKVSICNPLASLLKEHQIEGVKFCWDRICKHLLDPNASNDVFGGILAHSMGVGKSIQTVTLLHTLLTHPALVRSSAGLNGVTTTRIVRSVLLIAPVNTLANWEAEFQKWVGEKNLPFVKFLPWSKNTGRSPSWRKKAKFVTEWCTNGGVLCVSNATYASNAKASNNIDDSSKDGKDKRTVYQALVNPDMVVLDEAHTMLKNNSTSIFSALNNIQTKLRLCLTGTPLQNKLSEYYLMASWTKPGCLGTESQFINKYQNPIMDGMAADCTPSQAARQEELSAELHEKLKSIVHRCTKDVLKKVLPFMQEAIIHIRQSKAQTKLYREFNKYKRVNKVSFWDQYHALTPVSNHPACLPFFRMKVARADSPDSEMDVKKMAAPNEMAWFCDKCKHARFDTFEEAEEHEATCDESPDESWEDNQGVEKWWKSFHDNVMKSGLNINAIEHGGKIVALLQILAHCDAIGDKLVVFSKSLATLDFIEEILQSPNWHGFTPFLPNHIKSIGGWNRNKEYSRIDGQVDANERGDLIDTFNTVEHSKLFLVSIQAGGLGVNLVGANRVVLFDAHFNPAIIDQAIHRCYRFGQTKPVFVYQLLGEGSMEEKVFSRSKNKTALAELVIDEKNIDRLFSRRELDLMQENDTWVGCESCNKWRMLPPDMPDDEVANLPEKWYCKYNVHDPDRSTCDAPVRDALWYAFHWENRKKEIQGIAPYVATTNTGDSFNKLAKRDVVLETLLSRCEGSSNESGKKTINSWIAKYSFSKETIKDAEDEEVKNTDRKPITSPKKKKAAASPSRVSPRKSPKKSNAAASASDNVDERSPSQPAASVILGRIPQKRPSSAQKENLSNQSYSAAGNCTKNSHVKVEQIRSPKTQLSTDEKVASGRKRKSPQESSEKKKSPKLNTSSANKEPETIDLLDSDED